MDYRAAEGVIISKLYHFIFSKESLSRSSTGALYFCVCVKTEDEKGTSALRLLLSFVDDLKISNHLPIVAWKVFYIDVHSTGKRPTAR